jgi:hypothetical protein
LRELARTEPLPDALWVLAPHVDAATGERLTRFLTGVRTEHPDALKGLSYSGYAAPSAEQPGAWTGRVRKANVAPPAAAPAEPATGTTAGARPVARVATVYGG